MPRIRSIKPSYNRSLDIVALTPLCRYHFALLWTYADDEGRGLDHPALIRSELWPLDPDVTDDTIEAWQAELEQHGRIHRYEVDGRRYFVIHKFKDHQKPQKPQVSRLPDSPTVPVRERYANGTGQVAPVVGVVEGEVGELPVPSSDTPVAATTSEDDTRAAAAATLAALEAARRPDITNRDAWIRSRARSINRDHDHLWSTLLATDPATTPQQLVEATRPQRPDDPAARAQHARLTAVRCPTCHGSGHTLNDNGDAEPCPNCRAAS